MLTQILSQRNIMLTQMTKWIFL